MEKFVVWHADETRNAGVEIFAKNEVAAALAFIDEYIDDDGHWAICVISAAPTFIDSPTVFIVRVKFIKKVRVLRCPHNISSRLNSK